MARRLKLRTKVLLLFTAMVAAAVGVVTVIVSISTRDAFERMDAARRRAFLDQFRQAFAARGEAIGKRVDRAAASDEVARMAAGGANPDYSLFLNVAKAEAEVLGLDFLDYAAADGSIVSSAHWPARFGYKLDWAGGAGAEVFLTRVPGPDGAALALVAVRRQQGVIVAGGERVDSRFVTALGSAPGVRGVLWLPGGEPAPAPGLAEGEATVGEERFTALPLLRGKELLGILYVGTSLAEQRALTRRIAWIGLLVGGSGILMGVAMGFWVSRRVTKPVEQLAQGARALAAGDWAARVPVNSTDEVGDLAIAFNRMAEQLVAQRDRAIQAERVAAWRELARRLAHELNNPLFPLQITVENLQRARDRHPEQFDEVFREGTATLLTELANLRGIVGRFSDFAKMPPPRFEPLDAAEVMRDSARLFAAQCERAGVRQEVEVAGEARVEADAELLRRALSNLILNALDAMPEGGVLRMRASAHEGGVRLAVADSGQGLTVEECERIFTPYYTTKHYGTGLGLAIVQSVVSDHQGKISVESQPGKGAAFIIDLPERRSVNGAIAQV